MSIGAEIWDFVKKNFTIIGLGILLFIFYSNGGEQFLKGRLNKSDTTVKTEQILQPIVIAAPYQPQQAGTTVYPITIPAQYNPSVDLAALTAQYTNLVKEFLAEKRYKDSITLKDTAGNRVGVVNLDQTVSENTLKSTQPSYQLYFPKTTVTINNQPKPKTQVFVGVNTQFLMNNVVPRQVDVSFLLKNKKDKVFSGGIGYDFPNKEPVVRVGYYQKLSFKLF